ncbi:unnamed protein product [Rhizophagus irregularis]|nr:unnamed protein product [Rhizophagus irregularis]
MSQNTLQNNQNDLTFIEFSNLQSTVIQPENSSSNYNVNVNPSNNNFPTFYTNTNYLDQQSTSNTSTTSYAPHFDIPGFKIIVIPTSSSQQDNNYSNYSSSDVTNTQFTQFQQ